MPIFYQKMASPIDPEDVLLLSALHLEGMPVDLQGISQRLVHLTIHHVTWYHDHIKTLPSIKKGKTRATL